MQDLREELNPVEGGGRDCELPERSVWGKYKDACLFAHDCNPGFKGTTVRNCKELV